jgi:hypothetical protein
MADLAYCPLVGLSLAFGNLAVTESLQMVLLSGRTVTPAPAVGTYDAIQADVMGVPAVAVTGWTAPIASGRVQPTHQPVTFPTVPIGAGPITGAAIRASNALIYHAQLDVANEVATTGGDVTVSVGADGLLHVYAEVPA